MNRKHIPFLLAALVATGFIVGCGDQRDSRFSDADVIAFKQWRLQQMYGSAGSTSTSTVVQYVTVPSTTTVTTTP